MSLIPQQPTPAVRQREFVTLALRFHHHRGGQITEVPVGFERDLAGSEEPVRRTIEVTEQTRKLETYWLEDKVGFAVFQNVATHANPNVRPTAEQKAELERRVVQVTFGLDCVRGLLLPPGVGYPVYVEDVANVYLRCLSGAAQLAVWLFPL
jgi:hypothetical protein